MWQKHGTALDRISQMAWQLIRYLTLRYLWNYRCQKLHLEYNSQKIIQSELQLQSIDQITLEHYQAIFTYHKKRNQLIRASVFESLIHQHELIKECHSVNILPRKKGIIYFDGAASLKSICDGGSGSFVFDKNDTTNLLFQANYLPKKTTNNQAEYDGLIQALTIAKTQTTLI